jgi:hypothetical protein
VRRVVIAVVHTAPAERSVPSESAGPAPIAGIRHAVNYRLDARNGGLSTNSRFKMSAPNCRSIATSR